MPHYYNAFLFFSFFWNRGRLLNRVQNTPSIPTATAPHRAILCRSLTARKCFLSLGTLCSGVTRGRTLGFFVTGEIKSATEYFYQSIHLSDSSSSSSFSSSSSSSLPLRHYYHHHPRRQGIILCKGFGNPWTRILAASMLCIIDYISFFRLSLLNKTMTFPSKCRPCLFGWSIVCRSWKCIHWLSLRPGGCINKRKNQSINR